MTPPIVKRFLISFAQHKFLAFFIWVLIVGVSGVFAIQSPPPPPPPSYRATGELFLKPQPPTFTSTGEQLQQLGRQINEEILLSPRVKGKAAEELKQKLSLSNEQIFKAIERLKVTLPEEGELPIIALEYSDPQPDRAGLVLDVFMKEMVEDSRLRNSAQLRTKIEALQERLALVKADLSKAEGIFYRYISKDGSSLLAVQDGSLFNGITGTQAQQRQLQLALDEIQGQIDSLIKQLGLTPDQAYTSSALSADPIIATLRAQILQNETQLEQLGRDLRPEHPTMIELTKQQQSLEKLLQERASEVIGTDGILVPLPSTIRQESSLDPARQELANQLVALQTQREGLLRQLQSLTRTEQELRQQYEQFPEKELERARLVQEVQGKRALYQNILAALVDAQSAEAETIGSLDVSQPPFVQRVEAQPQQKLDPVIIMGTGAGVGLIAALGVIFLLATLDSRLHTTQELRSALGDRDVPLLGELPIVSSLNPKGEQTAILVDVDSLYLPFYERFRSNIRRLGAERSRVVLITSVANEEGKTVTAYNLAIASAHAGKRTLLVEADLRSPSSAKSINISPDPESIVEPLGYLAARNDCIRLVPEIENLYLVPSPGPQRQAAAIVESNELKMLLEDARRRFDMVVIDTPSLSKCNDALLIEPLADGIVLVTRPGMTQSNLLAEAIDQIEEAEIELLGAVINYVETNIPITDLPQEEIDTIIEEEPKATLEQSESETSLKSN
jgi:capsular exopolysaccharide synthesis family protein